jgi:hypothetical protein
VGAAWDFGTLVALVGVAVGALALGLQWAPAAEHYERWLARDPAYRALTVARLNGARSTALYRDCLTIALDWFDRHWGAAGSARALGVCTVIALCYAWTAFFITYAVGAAGRIGDHEWLPPAAPVERVLGAANAVLVPVLAFWLGRVLGARAEALERRLKLRLRRRWPSKPSPRPWRFEQRYRLASSVLIGALVLAIMLPAAMTDLNSPSSLFVLLLFWGTWLGVGPAVGLATSQWVRYDWLKGPVAALAVTVAVAIVIAVAKSLAIAGTLATAVAAAAVAAAAGAVTGAVAVVGAIVAAAIGAIVAAMIGTMVLAGPGAGAIAVIGAGAGAVAVASATRLGRRDRRGTYAGGIGVLLGLALIVGVGAGEAANQIVILLITFLLALPVANGLWDWLSWWASRWLGRHLLARGGAGGRAWTIAWHALADLGLALVLLASLAFCLAFAVEGWNQYAEARTCCMAYDLVPYIKDAAAAPWTAGLWLTVMLLSTLAPTVLHGVALLASPLVLLVIGSPRRAALATALAGYERARHPEAVLQDVGWYLARSQVWAWTVASLLMLFLLALLLGFIRLLHQGGLASWVAEIALAGVAAARWCF